VSDFSDATVHGLIELSTKYNFLIFEDQKFMDIDHMVQQQYHEGSLRISEWAHIFNASILAGDGIIEALTQTAQAKDFPYKGDRGLLILAEMTPKGSLATDQYTKTSIDIGRKHKDFVFGFVATRELGSVETESVEAEDEDFVIFTTCVNRTSTGDKLGQQYQTP
jgi:orotidine-5'-phosphate decarboxylase